MEFRTVQSKIRQNNKQDGAKFLLIFRTEDALILVPSLRLVILFQSSLVSLEPFSTYLFMKYPFKFNWWRRYKNGETFDLVRTFSWEISQDDKLKFTNHIEQQQQNNSWLLACSDCVRKNRTWDSESHAKCQHKSWQLIQVPNCCSSIYNLYLLGGEIL